MTPSRNRLRRYRPWAFAAVALGVLPSAGWLLVEQVRVVQQAARRSSDT